MERISTNGEVYVKASSIARELGYTADYVGQLCRSGQVDAQLVGRSWFVNEDSIREHKRNRYRSTRTKSKQMLSETLAEAIERSRSIATATEQSAHTAPVRYETDESDVMPVLGVKQPLIEQTEEDDSGATSDEGNMIPLRFEAETATAEEDEPVTEQEDAETPQNAIFHVPLRREEPSSAEALTPSPQRMVRGADVTNSTSTQIVNTTTSLPPRSQSMPSSVRKKESSEEVPSPLRAEHVVVLASLATAVALIGAVTLIGLEARVFVDQGGSLDTYQFNLAAAYEAAKDGLK
jgi:hypothetical protein